MKSDGFLLLLHQQETMPTGLGKLSEPVNIWKFSIFRTLTDFPNFTQLSPCVARECNASECKRASECFN